MWAESDSRRQIDAALEAVPISSTQYLCFFELTSKKRKSPVDCANYASSTQISFTQNMIIGFVPTGYLSLAHQTFGSGGWILKAYKEGTKAFSAHIIPRTKTLREEEWSDETWQSLYPDSTMGTF